MLYNDNLPVRYPKSKFAMWTAYSFTTASVLTSIFFSLLLFLSIDDDPVMRTLFGGLAIIFELGKFFAWYEVGERKSRRNYSGAFSAFMFYGILAAISIGGSVGGINSATNKAQNHVNIQQSQINAFNRQITAIDQQIALNNQGAQKYIELELISTGLRRIQKANDSLRQEQQTLAQERDNLPVVTQGSVLGLIDSLARTFNIDSQTAQLGLVVFLSVLLDFFAAFFIGLIGEEQRFCQRFRHTKTVTIETDEEPARPKLFTHHVGVDNNTVEPITKSLYEQAVEAFENKHINCSKRALIPFLNIDSEQAHVIFEQFMDEGLVSKKPNHHYRWHGKPIEV
jgi:TolA-binding protein